MKKAGGSVLLMLLFLGIAIIGAGALAIGGVEVIQRAAGAHSTEAPSDPVPATGPAEGALVESTAPAMTSAQRGRWAEEKIRQWLGNYGVTEVSQLNAPYRQVQAWFAPEEGHLELLVNTQQAEDREQLKKIATEVLQSVRQVDASLHQVTVSTSDGSQSYTAER